MKPVSRAILVFSMLVVVLPTLALVGPPAGQAPVNALRRVDPKKYDVAFEVVLSTTAATANSADRGLFNLKDVPIILPVIYQGTYSRTYPGSEAAQLTLDTGIVPDLPKSIDDNKPLNTHHLRIVIKEYRGTHVRWKMGYRMQSWSSEVNEQLAQQARWPRNMEWPEEVADGLKPQKYIESDHEIFQTILKSNGGDQLRQVSPYIAAKRIVAFCLNNFQVNGQGVNRGNHGILQGLRMQGALASIANAGNQRAMGSEHDIVCICVAMLRAAKIPARPVIGIEEQPRHKTLVSWAEFYLPGSGWVSFDPAAMLDKGSGQFRDVTRPWPEFGTMDELNERIPLSYHFVPPAGVVVPRNAALWGWAPVVTQPSYDQAITLHVTGRGKGEEDPG